MIKYSQGYHLVNTRCVTSTSISSMHSASSGSLKERSPSACHLWKGLSASSYLHSGAMCQRAFQLQHGSGYLITQARFASVMMSRCSGIGMATVPVGMTMTVGWLSGGCSLHRSGSRISSLESGHQRRLGSPSGCCCWATSMEHFDRCLGSM